MNQQQRIIAMRDKLTEAADNADYGLFSQEF